MVFFVCVFSEIYQLLLLHCWTNALSTARHREAAEKYTDDITENS